jgi:hypothetical protein
MFWRRFPVLVPFEKVLFNHEAHEGHEGSGRCVIVNFVLFVVKFLFLLLFAPATGHRAIAGWLGEFPSIV